MSTPMDARPEDCNCRLNMGHPGRWWRCPVHGRMRTPSPAEELGYGPARASEIMDSTRPLPEPVLRAIAEINDVYDRAEELGRRVDIALGILEVDSDWADTRLLDAIGDAIAALKGDRS